MKKVYTSPKVRSESVQIGVFGSYGSSIPTVMAHSTSTFLFAACCGAPILSVIFKCYK